MLPEGKCRYIDGQIYPDGNFYVLDTQHIKHNGSELKSALNGISTDISNKVDKVAGKGLSTEDYTTAEKNKLSGIEANANDYVHPTTSGNKHIPSGGSSGKILGWNADGTAAWVDPASGGGSVDTVYIGSTEYAPDANGKVTLPTYPTTLPASDVYSWAKASTKPSYTASEVGAIATTAKGANNGVAELDSSGKVPSSQLPSYVDDVLEYSAKASFPATGETGKIYVDTSTNLTYRWSGSAYTEISPSLALGETSSTAYRGDRGKAAYDHATDSSRLTTATASGLYKVASTAQGHIASLTAVVKSDITGLGIPAQDTTYSAATQSTDGLMSANDKVKLDNTVDVLNENIEKNLINLENCSIASTFSGLTFVRNGNQLTVSCTGAQTAVQSIYIDNICVPTYTDLILSGCPSGGSDSTYLVDAFNNNTNIPDSIDKGTGSQQAFQFTTMTNSRIRIRVAANYAFTNKVFKIMLCKPAIFKLSPTFSNFNPLSSWAGKKKSFTSTAANTMQYTGLSFTVPAGHIYEFFLSDGNGQANPTGIGVCDSNTNYNANSTIIAENMDVQSSSASNVRLWTRQVSGITVPYSDDVTYYVWVKRSTASNGIITLLTKRIF